MIRSAREAIGMSARHLARAVDVHHSFINGLERGRYQSAKPPVLQRLSRVLELDERDLFALAGLEAPEGLPAFTPYLRAKYEMSDEAARTLEDHFHYVRDRYDVKPKPGQRPHLTEFNDPAQRRSRPDHPAYEDPTLATDPTRPKQEDGGTQ